MNNIKKYYNLYKKSELKSEYDIIINLLLVKFKARKAYLLEPTNFSSFNYNKKRIINIIKKIDSDFVFTNDKSGGERVFITLNNIKTPNTNEEIGKLLGFQCLGIPNRNTERKTVNYSVKINNKEYIFYTEVCPKNTIIKNKVNDFNSVLKKINMTAYQTVNIIYPDWIWKKVIVNKDIDWFVDKNNEKSFKEYVDGCGYPFIFKYNIINLIKNNYELILSVILRCDSYFKEPVLMSISLNNRIKYEDIIELIEENTFKEAVKKKFNANDYIMLLKQNYLNNNKTSKIFNKTIFTLISKILLRNINKKVKSITKTQTQKNISIKKKTKKKKANYLIFS